MVSLLERIINTIIFSCLVFHVCGGGYTVMDKRQESRPPGIFDRDFRSGVLSAQHGTGDEIDSDEWI